MIYLDNAATTALTPRIKSLLEEKYDIFGNPGSPHQFGKIASTELEAARHMMAELFGVDPTGLYFTSGATESINLLFQGYAKFLTRNSQNSTKEIIISRLEHPAVYQAAHYLRASGFVIHEIENNPCGVVDLIRLGEIVNEQTVLVAIMTVNNETGVIQPIEEIVQTVKSKNQKTLVFSDTVQALGKVSVENITNKVDAFCGSAHKVGGPKGAGFLYVNPEFRIFPLFYGGAQEHSLRPGTENVPGVSLMAESFFDAIQNLDANSTWVQSVNAHLENQLIKNGIPYKRTIPVESASPFIFSVQFPISSNRVLDCLSENGIYISKRSACSSQSHTKSRILESMNIDDESIDQIVRISFSPATTIEEIDTLVEVLSSIVK